MQVLFENNDLIVCVKSAGVLSEESGGKRSMPLLLRAYAEEKGEKDARFYSVHRLDRDVGGVMVYAKNPSAAARLSEEIREGRAQKEYLAVVRGAPEKEGVWEDLLFRDSKTMKTYVVDRKRAGVRAAKLAYKRLDSAIYGGGTVSLVLVKLYTGRTHQIRVQFASRGFPLLGDGRYGSGDGGERPALFSRRMRIEGEFDCRAEPCGAPFDLFDAALYQKTF